jgi:uncharacterized protein (TIGR02679 family)
VCENPTVLAAAADRLGSRSIPMVCIEGKPRTPAARLLRSLTATGAQLRYHGDFDWEGIRIANFMMRRLGVIPWRMDRVDYEAASDTGIPLSGTKVTADWDPGLAPRMSALGKTVHEEAVLDSLFSELSESFKG